MLPYLGLMLKWPIYRDVIRYSEYDIKYHMISYTWYLGNSQKITND